MSLWITPESAPAPSATVSTTYGHSVRGAMDTVTGTHGHSGQRSLTDLSLTTLTDLERPPLGGQPKTEEI